MLEKILFFFAMLLVYVFVISALDTLVSNGFWKMKKRKFNTLMFITHLIGVAFYLVLVLAMFTAFGLAYIYIIAALAGAAIVFGVYELGTLISASLAEHFKNPFTRR